MYTNNNNSMAVVAMGFLSIIGGYFVYFIFNDISLEQDALHSYLIKNEHNIQRDLPCENCFIVKEFHDKNYYTDMSISVDKDSAYTIVLWGNREHVMYNLKKDFILTVDIPYNRYKGKDVTQQVKLYQILTNKIHNVK